MKRQELFGTGDIHIRLRSGGFRAGDQFRGLTIKHVWHFESVKHKPNIWETLVFTNNSASCNCFGWREYRTCWHTHGHPLPRFSGLIDWSKPRNTRGQDAKKKADPSLYKSKKNQRKYNITPDKVAAVIPKPKDEKPKWKMTIADADALKTLGWPENKLWKFNEEGAKKAIAEKLTPQTASLLPDGNVRKIK